MTIKKLINRAVYVFPKQQDFIRQPYKEGNAEKEAFSTRSTQSKTVKLTPHPENENL